MSARTPDMRFGVLLWLAAMLTLLPASGARADDAVALGVEKYKLDNGLEVVLHEDHRTPIVAVNVWYHVGSKDEPEGRNGFAHLFEHLMFQGSRHVGEDQFFKYLERAGASDRNGTTGDDRTNYYETVPSNQLALALWLESDRMGFLLDHVDQATFETQRDVVLNERRQNYENAPYGLVHKFVREALYPPEHPYHRLPIGTPEDLSRATLDDVYRFFHTFYAPNNATLVIAGDIVPSQAKALVERYFATLAPAPGQVPRRAARPVVLNASKRLEVRAEVELPRVSMSWPTPPVFAPGDAELDLLGEVLSDGKSSRLYKRLVYELQMAQGVGAHQSSSELGSTFEISATLKRGQDPEKALAILDEELEKLRRDPPSEAEVQRAKAQLTSRMVFALEKVGTRADLFNQYNQATGDPAYFTKDLARYEGATRDGVAKALTLLPSDRRVVVVVRPTKGAPRAGELVGGDR